MPAYNGLALTYLTLAQRGTNRAASLAMGLRVCREAVAPGAHPPHAPTQNTLGLIQWQLGDVGAAIAAFEEAVKVDPSALEPRLNLGAAANAIRDFGRAEVAYRRAVTLAPNDYGAHLGLALALRGRNTPNAEANAHAELDRCKALDPKRPDAFYNDGIVFLELDAKTGTGKEKTITALRAAQLSLRKFTELAKGKPEYDAHVKRAAERIKDADDAIVFLNAT
jgi:tetratricopeptide (TPR) repeat protein